MSWYNTKGPYSDFVLFSKARYIRNIAKQPFDPIGSSKRGDEPAARLDSLLSKSGFRCDRLPVGVTPALLALAEKQFVERDLVYSDRPRALYLNEPCNLVIATGGGDFLSISSILAGASVGEARNMAAGAEELIDREIAFAYLEGVGYLSPDPANCGSGLSLTSALYLPSLRRSDLAPSLLSSLSRVGMTLRPAFCGRDESDLYTLSYSPHPLCDEESAVKHFSDTVISIIEEEKRRLGMIFKNKDKTIFESARRALGILLYSPSLSEGEMLRLLSDIRLCHCVGGGGQSDALPSVQTLNYLSAEGLSASVISSSKEKCGSLADVERARAILISSYIEHVNEVKNVK